VSDLRLEVGKEVIGIEAAEFIAHGHVSLAFGEGRPGHPSGLLGHGMQGTRIE